MDKFNNGLFYALGAEVKTGLTVCFAKLEHQNLFITIKNFFGQVSGMVAEWLTLLFQIQVGIHLKVLSLNHA